MPYQPLLSGFWPPISQRSTTASTMGDVTREEVLADLVGLLPAASVVEGNGWPAVVRFFDGVRHIEAAVYVSRIGEPGAGASGQARPRHERRFQNPGQGHPIHIDPDRPTLLLGIADREAPNSAGANAGAFMTPVIAGFDAARHAGRDTRISVQMHVSTLQEAARVGYHTQLKANGELIVAFRPELIGPYIDSVAPLVHDGDRCRPEDAEDVGALFEVIQAAEEAQVSEQPGGISASEALQREERKRVRRFADRKVRDSRFRRMVKLAYDGQCAMCPLQLDLVIGAHIDPVEADGPDDVRNGLSLCPTHHAAFDRHLIEIDEDSDFAITVNEDRVEALREAGQAGGINELRKGLIDNLRLPARPQDRPLPEYFRRRRAYYFPEATEPYEGVEELL